MIKTAIENIHCATCISKAVLNIFKSEWVFRCVFTFYVMSQNHI